MKDVVGGDIIHCNFIWIMTRLLKILTGLTYMRKISHIGQFFVTNNLNARKQDEENFEYLDFIGIYYNHIVMF